MSWLGRLFKGKKEEPTPAPAAPPPPIEVQVGEVSDSMVVCPVCQREVGHLPECPEMSDWDVIEFKLIMTQLAHDLAVFEAELLNARARKKDPKRAMA